jgi:uncharacterized protein YecE (DUF72 family)
VPAARRAISLPRCPLRGRCRAAGAAAHHGHSGTWDSRDIHERFGYRYTGAGLTEWAPRVRALAEDTALTHGLFNICYRGNAQANAHHRALFQSWRASGRPAPPK